MTNSKIVPLSYDRHGNMSWRSVDSLQFSAQDQYCPLTAHELPRAVMAMPLGFIKSQQGFELIALQGLFPKRNLFCRNDGKWRASYIPEFYRLHPLLAIQNPAGDFMVGVDESSEFVLQDDSANPFYLKEKQFDERIRLLIEQLSQFASNLQATKKICAKLNELDLLCEWPLKVNTTEGEFPLKGLYAIDEKNYSALDGDSIINLRDSGALTVIYCQLFSQVHIKTLYTIAEKLMEGSTSEPLFRITSDASEALNFDNL